MRDFFTKNIRKEYFFLIVLTLLTTACRSPQTTDLRKLVPSDTLVYLETNDVAAMLESLTASQAFQTLAKDKTDFSALKNIQLAVAVTGFETAAENSVLSLKPRFVAVAETHAWNWQAVALVENQLDQFVRKNYGETAKLIRSDKDEGRFYIWTADDQRQVFAFVQGSLIYFGNDAAAIEKCSAIRKGAAESLAQNEFFNRAYSNKNMAFGYVSKDGVKRIADLAGVSFAVGVSEETDEKSFIARVVPQILQNTTKEIVWTANRTANEIEDKYTVNLTDETVSVLKQTVREKTDSSDNFADFMPPDVYLATRYNLNEMLVAWRGSLLLTAKNTDALSGKILINFSGKLLEPYGIADAETFLSAVDSPIMTANFDAEGEKSVTVTTIKNAEKLKTSISKEINFKKPPEKISNAEIWFSADKNLAAAFIENKLILGDGTSVLKCLQATSSAKNLAFQRFAASRSLAVTFGTDADSADKIVKVLANVKDENRRLATFYTTETRLTETGFERVTVSDFGLLGTILGKLN